MFKKIAKRILPILLVVVMLFTAIPMQAFAATQPAVADYESFLYNLTLLEWLADIYVTEGGGHGKDPLALVIKYIRTGVDRYNSGSWGIMAGYEDSEFADFVLMMQEEVNQTATSEEEKLHIDGLKNLNNFTLPNGDEADFGHIFGTMDISYHNKGSENHADVGGWAGDLVDLLDLADEKGVSGSIEEMTAIISRDYLGKDFTPSPGFSLVDIYGDLDAYYIMQKLYNTEYANGTLTQIFMEYFTDTLSAEDRAEFLLKNRLGSTGTRENLRNIVYDAYTSNKVVTTLEGSREFNTSDLTNLRKATCYSFADYLCKLAGDYVENTDNPYFEEFYSEVSTLAPGVTQEIKYANSADNKQMVYYLATADITREDVNVYANYNENDPSKGWATSRVIDQANAAQAKYGDPNSSLYIPNYNVVASVNGAGYNMETGEPSGLLVMNGVTYHNINNNGFFGILNDGTAVIASTKEYNELYKDKVKEGIAGFGATLIKNGQIVVSDTTNYFDDRASRTAVGITKTGKVVFLVLDGRQEPFSNGGSMIEIAQILLNAGCVNAVNLDGGGSTTFVAKQPGDDALSLMNNPSDGFARSVSTSLMVVSTAPSSTKFDHAELESEYDYLTVGTELKIDAIGLSATENATEIPEGTSWALSDESIGTISEDGVFTAVSEGYVEIKLMLDGAAVGNKTINVVSPEKLYFKKTTLDAVYGATVELPVVALYQNKAVKTTAKDFTFTVSNTNAGKVEDMSFIGIEGTNLKVVTVTAALANNADAVATVTINLYNQGEATFDFDQATGGDRQLAWDRQVSNSETDDKITYVAVDADKDMVTSYIVALDMTQIPIPEVLEDLTYMLPGADVEGACAWTFLCQLAKRISNMTEVKTEFRIDPRFDVDYSELLLVNDYFTIGGATLDEETNILTITLNWKKCTQPINPDTANPMCIVSGIKLTPKKDADWGSNGSITAINTGNISYTIYMQASALYSFAQKEENQKIYGLYPYTNPEDSADEGGYFGETYKEFYDSYTLIGGVKNGWVNENGGYAYYVDGEKYTGIKLVEGYYYDFGIDGINVGQTKYTGLLYDDSADVYRYSKLGEISSGWNTINGEWYYFSGSTKAAAKGRVRMYGVYYTFEETGRLTSGVWANTLKGTRYYYGPSYYTTKWQQIDGEWYYFKDGYRLTGFNRVGSLSNDHIKMWYDFGDDGVCRELEDGLYTINGGIYYIVGGIHQIGLQKVDGYYYFFTYAGKAVCGQSYYAWETHCDLPCSTYAFGLDGKMVDGLAKMNNGTYYYVNGKVVSNKAGLTKIGDDYYFVATNGRCATGKYYVWATNCDLPCGEYEFDADGKMLQGIVKKSNGTYYYVNGKINGKNAGLTKIGDDYYFIAANGRCATGKYYAWATNCDLPCGEYEFDADGKMLQGIVKKANGTYYYVNGKLSGKNAGLTKVGEDYYFVAANGRCATGKYYAWATHCDLPCSEYEFDADGKMLQGIVEKDGKYYYYINGKLSGKNAGLTKVGEDYYFVAANGRCATGKYYAWATNCDLPCGNYEFGADGKMLHGITVKADGIYCYVNGKLGGSVAGLTKIGEDYYFVTSSGKCVTGKYYAWATNCDLPCGNYEFGADGKMLDGFVTKSNGIYYYENGKLGKVGLNYIDGYYYFITANGKLVTNQSYYAWETNGLLIETTYTFDEYGRIVA